MQILIKLAGQQIGPFSELQVRRYLEEGLVSPTDLAFCKGMRDWQPVEDVLDHVLTAYETTTLPDLTNLLAEPATSPPPTNVSDTRSLSSEPFLALVAAQKARQKAKTGALPTVSDVAAATEKTATKSLPKSGPLSLRDVPGKIEAAKILSAKSPDSSPAKTVAAPESADFMPPPLERSAHPDDEAWFSQLTQWAFYACCAIAVFAVGVIGYYAYKATKPHDTSQHGVLLKSDVVPPPAPTSTPAPSTASTDTGNPKTADDYANRGLARVKDKDVNGAMADFNQALNLDQNNALASYNRGLLRQQMGDLNGALTDFTTTITTDPKSAHAFNNRAYVKQMLNDPDGAAADYSQVLFLDPTNAIAYYNLGLIRMQKGDLDGAISAFGLALDNDPKMAVVYYKRGNVKNAEGNVEGAIADYTQAIILDPKNALAFCDRGFARQMKGDLEGALSDYTEALALDNKLTLVYYNRCLIRLGTGDFEGAIDDATHAIELDGKNGPAYGNRGLARFGKGDYEDALTDLRAFCQLSPRDPGTDRARLFAWIAATRLNPHGTADQDLSTAVQTDWNSPPEDFISKIAAFLLGHMREDDLIENAASPDESQEPGQYCRAWYFVGIKHRQAGDINTAATDFQKCIATDQREFCEYIFAKNELKALRPDAANTTQKAAPSP
jgi:tetratricopeptide (TPR) repeat protein